MKSINYIQLFILLSIVYGVNFMFFQKDNNGTNLGLSNVMENNTVLEKDKKVNIYDLSEQKKYLNKKVEYVNNDDIEYFFREEVGNQNDIVVSEMEAMIGQPISNQNDIVVSEMEAMTGQPISNQNDLVVSEMEAMIGQPVSNQNDLVVSEMEAMIRQSISNHNDWIIAEMDAMTK